MQAGPKQVGSNLIDGYDIDLKWNICMIEYYKKGRGIPTYT
jgi:hypothetical protein